jgi:hypothetical protein
MKKASNWNYYSVRIIKQIVVQGKRDIFRGEQLDELNVQRFEESIMLVRAQSCNHARGIAEEKAKGDETPYLNAANEEVCWRFVKIVDCFEINDVLKSGAEIYSCFHTVDNEVTADVFVSTWFKDEDNNES